MKRNLLLLTLAVSTVGGIATWLNAQQAPDPEAPRYTAQNRMYKPVNYREWVWVSSGFDMSYRAGTPQGNETSTFDNVFASPKAYRAFMNTGHWPDKTVLVLEARYAVGRRSINQSGHFQGDVMAIEVHVKDLDRFKGGGWAFFNFENKDETGTLFPQTAACYSCHEQNGAVDTTFVQFYPTLFEVAQRKATLKPDYEANR
jgi:Cytochrome P460